MKILLVDDDADDRLLFQEVIQLIDPSVTCITAGNGEVAMKLLTSGLKPDLVFLDINMPIMNGIACLKAIRSDEELKHLAVVIVSTSISRENERLFQVEGTPYMEKPNDYDKLERELAVHIMEVRQKLAIAAVL